MTDKPLDLAPAWNPAETLGCAISLAFLLGTAAAALEGVMWVVRVVFF